MSALAIGAGQEGGQGAAHRDEGGGHQPGRHDQLHRVPGLLPEDGSLPS